MLHCLSVAIVMSNQEDEAANLEGADTKDVLLALSDLEDIGANLELDEPEVASLHSSDSDADSSCQSSNCAAMTMLIPRSFRQAGHGSKRKRITVCSSDEEKALYLSCKAELDEEIARMFYSAGLPFNLAKNPHFIRAFSLAAICNMERYDCRVLMLWKRHY